MLPTAALMLCMSELTRRVLQATACEGPSQGPYVAAKAGFEPATLRTQGTEPTTETPRQVTTYSPAVVLCCKVGSPSGKFYLIGSIQIYIYNLSSIVSYLIVGLYTAHPQNNILRRS